MISSDTLDDPFHAAAILAYVTVANVRQAWPESEEVRTLAYRLYEDALAGKQEQSVNPLTKEPPMSNMPDDFSPAAFADAIGDSPRALAYENAIEREYLELLYGLTDETKAPGKHVTNAQQAVWDLFSEQDIDGALFAGILAAAKHLKNRKSVTPEQVGQALIDALAKDLEATAEREAGDSD